MIKIACVLLILINAAFGQEKSAQTAATIMVDHYAPTYENTDAYSTTSFYGTYKLDKENTLALYQIIIKNYLVEENEDEVQLDDLRAYWFYKVSDDFDIRYAATAAISNSSQRKDHIGTAGLRFSVNSKYFKDKLDFKIRPFATYYFNEYKQSVDGDPLTQYRVGASLYGAYSFSDQLSIVTIFSSSLNYLEKGVNNGSEDMEGAGSNSIDSYLNYDYSKNVSLRFGYTFSDSQIVDGRYEMYAFRPDGGAAINLGLDYNF